MCVRTVLTWIPDLCSQPHSRYTTYLACRRNRWLKNLRVYRVVWASITISFDCVNLTAGYYLPPKHPNFPILSQHLAMHFP